MDNILDAYKKVKNFDKYQWEITVDNGMKMYTCRFCGCRMTKLHYDLAVGINAFNFCPYCGSDMRPEQVSMPAENC